MVAAGIRISRKLYERNWNWARMATEIEPKTAAGYEPGITQENDVLMARRFAAGLVQRVLDEIASQLRVARKAGRAGVATSNS
jgi:hypothetical protein